MSGEQRAILTVAPAHAHTLSTRSGVENLEPSTFHTFNINFTSPANTGKLSPPKYLRYVQLIKQLNFVCR